jgi:hypothetical protein
VTEAGGRLAIDPALTERLIADAQGADALPLLGFTLERLYSDYGAEGRLSVAEYERLGGVKGSIEAAVTAALAEPGRAPVIPVDREEQFAALREAFIPRLARIDPETGAPRRRLARRDEIPPGSRGIVERLIEARLLVADRRQGVDVIEVAHESLLRQWSALTAWLAEDRADLQLLSRLEQEASRWHTAVADKDGLLLPSGIRLVEAEDLVARRSDLLSGDLSTVSFIHASSELNARRQNELEAARRRRLYRARLTAAIMGTLALLSVASTGVIAVGVSNVRHGLNLAVASIEVETSNNPLSLSEHAAGNLIRNVATIRTFLLSRILNLGSNPEFVPWTVAQIAVALEGDSASPLTPDKLRSFMDENRDRTCSCWKETADKMPHTVASSWVLYSLARYQIQPGHPPVSWLLDAQKPEGWWTMFPETDDKKNASTSATAWAVLALDELNERGLLSPDEQTLAAQAILRGTAWLKKTRLKGKARWKEYPEGQEVDDDYAAVSALVLHALRKTDANNWNTSLDAEWLRALPDNTPGLFDYDQSKGLVTLQGNYLTIDEVRHYRLPWELRATTDAYNNSSILGKSAAHLWINGILRKPISTEELRDRDWVAAEILIAFRHTSEALRSR